MACFFISFFFFWSFLRNLNLLLVHEVILYVYLKNVDCNTVHIRCNLFSCTVWSSLRFIFYAQEEIAVIKFLMLVHHHLQKVPSFPYCITASLGKKQKNQQKETKVIIYMDLFLSYLFHQPIFLTLHQYYTVLVNISS